MNGKRIRSGRIQLGVSVYPGWEAKGELADGELGARWLVQIYCGHDHGRNGSPKLGGVLSTEAGFVFERVHKKQLPRDREGTTFMPWRHSTVAYRLLASAETHQVVCDRHFQFGRDIDAGTLEELARAAAAEGRQRILNVR